MPEESKTGYNKASFMSRLITGPKTSIDGVNQWSPRPLQVTERKTELIEFKITGIMAPTETLRRIKNEEIKVIVDNEEDKAEIRKLNVESKEKDKKLEEERKMRETHEEELRNLKRKMNEIEELNKLTAKDTNLQDEKLKAIKEKEDEIEELKRKLKESEEQKNSKLLKTDEDYRTPKRKHHDKNSQDRSREKSKSKHKRDRSEDEKENITDFKVKEKQTIVKTGLDAEEVIRLLKTVIESTRAGIPIDTPTLGLTGASAKEIPEELIKDLNEFQKDKINFVGARGGSTVIQSNELSRKDKITLMKLGLGREFLATEPNIEKELSDPHPAWEIIFKFVVLKTAETEDNSIKIPTKLYMMFKFFTFPECTSPVWKLINPEDEKEEFSSTKTKSSYGIVRDIPDQNEVDNEEKITWKIKFRVDPSSSKIKDENVVFYRYLKERMLSVDLFDAYSFFHFGTTKISLNTLLRQGKELNSTGQECDICEPKFGKVIGKIQIIMSNLIVN